MARSPQNNEKNVFYTGELYGLTGMWNKSTNTKSLLTACATWIVYWASMQISRSQRLSAQASLTQQYHSFFIKHTLNRSSKCTVITDTRKAKRACASWTILDTGILDASLKRQSICWLMTRSTRWLMTGVLVPDAPFLAVSGRSGTCKYFKNSVKSVLQCTGIGMNKNTWIAHQLTRRRKTLSMLSQVICQQKR